MEDRRVDWHFRGVILEKLENYFYCLRHLRRLDPDSYSYFSRVGFTLPATALFAGYPDAAHRWTANAPLPSTGGVFLPVPTDADEKVSPTFIFFKRLNAPRRIQAYRGVIYAVTAVFDDRKHRGVRALLTYHLGIAPSGDIHLLAEACQRSGRIRRRRGGSFSRTWTEWGIPETLQQLATEQEHTPEYMAAYMFTVALLTAREAEARILVRVTATEGLTCAFGIALPRAKVFFRDRDVTAVTPTGQRKRIFHAVVAHTRQLEEGKTVDVRAHYRGIRHFDWQGYGVGIVLPGNLEVYRQFAAAGTYAEDLTPKEAEEMVTEREAGQRLDDLLSQ